MLLALVFLPKHVMLFDAFFGYLLFLICAGIMYGSLELCKIVLFFQDHLKLFELVDVISLLTQNF